MKKLYTAPQLTVVAVRVERGYAESITVSLNNNLNTESLFGSGSFGSTEDRSARSGWTADDFVTSDVSANDESFW